MAEKFTNNFASTVADGGDGITDAQTTIGLADSIPAALADGDWRLLIESEIIIVHAFTDDDITDCTRGAEGTSAASHSESAAATHLLTAGAVEAIKKNLCPTRATMWHDESTVIAGNAIALTLATEPYGFHAVQSTAANGDRFTQSFVITEGIYTLYVMGSTVNNRGKIDWYIDDVLVVSGQDWYASSTSYGVVKSQGSISVPGNGRHVLKGVVNGKNASSSGYYIALNKMWLSQSSDVGSV